MGQVIGSLYGRMFPLGDPIAATEKCINWKDLNSLTFSGDYFELEKVSFLIRLPECVFLTVLQEWLTAKDIAVLDKAMTNRIDRSLFHSVLRNDSFSIERSGRLISSECYLQWLSSRKVQIKTLHLVSGQETSKALRCITSSNTIFGIENLFVSNYVLLKKYFNANSKSLKKLAIRDEIMDLAFILDWLLFHKFPKLEKLELSFVKIEENNKLSLNDLDKKYSRATCQLKVFDCTYCNISEEFIITVIKRCPQLEELNLYSCKTVTFATFLTIGVHCKGLKVLNLGYHCTIVDDDVIPMFSSLTELRSITLTCNGMLSDLTMRAIAECCSNLEVVDIRQCVRLTDDAMIFAASKCPNLRHVIIMYNTRINGDFNRFVLQNNRSIIIEERS